MSFDKSLIDFGTIKQGEKKTHTFFFTNTGDTALEIEIVTACDCTSLSWPEGKIIQPGEKGFIKATFDSTKEGPGDVLKTIDIIANTEPIVVELKYKANIVK